MEAHAEEAQTHRLGDRANLRQVCVDLLAGLVQVVEQCTGQLQLAARFERDRTARALQRDDLTLFFDAPPAELLRHAFKQGADAAFTGIADRAQTIDLKSELFMFGADPPLLGWPTAGLEKLDQRCFVSDWRIRRGGHVGSR